MYVNYCKNKPDSTQLILEHAGPYFDVSDRLVIDKTKERLLELNRETQVKVCLTKHLTPSAEGFRCVAIINHSSVNANELEFCGALAHE